MGKYFGTDGFRGEAGITLTADHAYKVGRFLGWYYNALRERNGDTDPARIVIGKDTRRSSYMFEYSLVAGLTASGADAYLLHVTTTPSVAYVARVDDFDCGIMISASHNPYYDNGIKLIDCYGEKMPEEILLLVEDYIDGKLHVFDKDWPELPFAHREHIGCTVDYVAGRNRYMGYLISLGIYSFKGVKVGLDCANGSSCEFQILADNYGNVIHLGERDCSIQRNHQKMVEESPSAALDEKTRQQMGEMAVKAARAVGYTNAGTVEFLLDKNKNFYFMEVNTRIQVEHGVTEMMTGVDLIKEQIKIASGEHLAIKQQDVKLSGAAIEMRINAENPYKKFAPCPGKISDLHIPGGNEVRVDTAVYTGYTIPPFYDSMIMKIIVHDKDRRQAINKMKSVLGEVVIDGITTNRDFQYEICNNKRFETGDITTDFIAQEFPDFI